MPDTLRPDINIALTGWPGVGTSTLTLLLALILDMRYVYIGSVFRTINEKLKVEGEHSLSSEFEQMIQPLIGKTIDTYVDHILLNKSGIILESDLSAFRIGKHPKVYSIFIRAGMEARKKREAKDGRVGVDAPLEERDAALREEYIKLWDTDIFDDELIARKYNVIIDNSSLTVEEEITAILDRVARLPQMKGTTREQLHKRAQAVLKRHAAFDKESMRKDLLKKKADVEF
ncbi:MAG: Cytidylate kinase [candidate division WS6 bacterium OLB20]|uniref:Cytidylate kinase n=1 Tax=candidate division WS6 bacterium OLB20 TaxID=1617426 RepID=A0A136M0N3_9BACT|nr:MAG: Cytidylate kinase [candidate division WS6 bacterium OLB20]